MNTVKTPRTGAGEASRNRLLETAQRLFWERGYGATSIADICREAGANPGSMYYFFPTKEALLEAVLERYRDGIHAGLLDPVWSATPDPMDRIFGLLDIYRTNLLATDFAYGCPIGNLALELADPPAGIRSLLAANFDRWTAAIHECLVDLEGRFEPGADLDQLSALVLTTMEGGVMQARTQRSIEPFDHGVDALHDYLTRLMGDR